MKQRVVIAGGTGLVGSQVVTGLISRDDIELHMLLRRTSGNPLPCVHQHAAPTESWPALVQEIKPDIAISCLGTTMKIAGSRAAFHAVDHDLLLDFANAAKQSGARHMICVSSVGAMPASSSFYLRTKAAAEQGLCAISFDRLDIFRPGLLTGGERKDMRTGETVAMMLAPFTNLLMIGPFRKYASTPSAKLAQAIVSLISTGGTGQYIHANDSINTLAS